jgi:electron transport complex protein RnfB
MSRVNVTAKAIDAILPQTQCGLCGYGGCMPYAEGLIRENAAIDLCPPGGVKGLQAIAKLVNEDPTPFMTSMAEKTKPKLTAVIREAECIGCTKCIQACPVDAILGSAKLMHTVITRECTGCELCVAPCPVDCIDMVPVTEASEAEEKQKADLARERFVARQERLEGKPIAATPAPEINPQNDKKAFIEAALARARMKRNGSDSA